MYLKHAGRHWRQVWRTWRKYLHKKSDRTIEKLLTSIPGVGPTIADILITEIGSIDKFHSGKSLVAFAGIDPRVKQSGASLRRNTRITKRGSPHLRHILYFATVVAQLHYKEFRDHFLKKHRSNTFWSKKADISYLCGVEEKNTLHNKIIGNYFNTIWPIAQIKYLFYYSHKMRHPFL